MVMFLFIMAIVLSGVIGYFIAYVQNEKKSRKSKKTSSKYNGYNGWYTYW